MLLLLFPGSICHTDLTANNSGGSDALLQSWVRALKWKSPLSTEKQQKFLLGRLTLQDLTVPAVDVCLQQEEGEQEDGFPASLHDHKSATNDIPYQLICGLFACLTDHRIAASAYEIL